MKNAYDPIDTSHLKPITDIKEIQSIERGILERVAAFCEDREIRYSLCSGTLLGAVRHKGFIPWDNDVDIAMPRPDYKRFISEFSADGLSLHNIENDKNYGMWFSKVFNDKTLVLEGKTEKSKSALCIDVFPLDGFPDIKTLQRVRLRFYRLWKCHYIRFSPFRLVMRTQKRVFYKMIMIQAAKIVLKILFCVLPKQYFLRRITKNFSQYGYENQPYIGGAFWNPKEYMPRVCAETYVDVEFEGRSYKAFKGWDVYLTNSYGDYMTLPPVGDRYVHPIEAWWK